MRRNPRKRPTHTGPTRDRLGGFLLMPTAILLATLFLATSLLATSLMPSATPALSQTMQSRSMQSRLAWSRQDAASLPAPHDIVAVGRRVNDYWMANRPGPEDNNWSRATYFTGNMAFYEITGEPRYLDQAWAWAEDDFDWQLHGGCTTVFAENHTAAQIYLALYAIDPQRSDLACLLQSMETSMSWGWLEIDLGDSITITRFDVSAFENRSYRYMVDAKNAPSDPYTLLVDASDGRTGERTVAPTPARFVRLRVLGAAGYNGLRVSLNEIGIYGDSAPTTNLALNRPTVCSSEPEPQNRCANAVDGNLATAWSAIVSDDFTIESPKWWWVDALYVAAPVFATLDTLERAGKLPGKLGYSSALFAKYDETKEQRALWDAGEGLWYRDARYLTLRSPNDQKILWSRGNGWAFAALARMLDTLPADDPHYQEYLETFQAMAYALIARQEQAGYWNQNLADPAHCGGPESSGTAFFVYGLAWGINHHYLDRATFLPAVAKAWEWLAATAVQSAPDGLLGYVQPVGDAPVCTVDFPLPGPTDSADFGVGAFLLATGEVFRLATPDSTHYLPLVAQ